MIPVQFPESNGTLARDQGEYEPMAIYHFGDTEGRIACCFRLSVQRPDDLPTGSAPSDPSALNRGGRRG